MSLNRRVVHAVFGVAEVFEGEEEVHHVSSNIKLLFADSGVDKGNSERMPRSEKLASAFSVRNQLEVDSSFERTRTEDAVRKWYNDFATRIGCQVGVKGGDANWLGLYSLCLGRAT